MEMICSIAKASLDEDPIGSNRPATSVKFIPLTFELLASAIQGAQ